MDDKIDLNRYQEISRNKGLPPMCPIRDFCQRREKTLFYFSSHYNTENHNYANMEVKLIDASKKINEIGTPLEYHSNNRDLKYFYNACPEVNLFDNNYSLIENYAISSGTLDKGVPNNYLLKYKHFSTCNEYNQYVYLNQSPNNLPDMNHFEPELRSKIETLMINKEYNSVVRTGFVHLTETIRKKINIEEKQLDGSALINLVFSSKNNLVILEEEKRQAYRNLLDGLYGVYRNKYAHNEVKATNYHEIKAIIEMINNISFEIHNLKTKENNA